MALAAGTRLGPYEIVAPLGAGGMGEVYRGRDTRLDRIVAIKVLPEQLASDAQFRERFEREARLVASLSHPYICTLHDVGRHGEVDFLVMEYLEGETLQDRLARSAIPLAEALQTGIQIADALAAAHRAGVIHRDLKPGNIMLTKSGAKLLDFGLAKVDAPAAAGTISMLPTTPPGLTVQGTILGTFQYMAPEQLEGKDADARTDIFAFGSVLYEMLTGRKAFEGQSQASLIGAILKDTPPPVSTLQPLAAPALDRVVAGCLAKDPDDRWHAARDVMLQLNATVDNAGDIRAATEAPARSRYRDKLAWGAAVVGVLVGAAGFVSRYVDSPAADLGTIQFEIDVSSSSGSGFFAVSPDGRHVVFLALSSGGARSLWLRSFDSSVARALPGTEAALNPFWSPDSQFVGFFAEGRLKVVRASGGPPRILCDAPSSGGGSWSRDGVIVFGSAAGPLYRVSETGGVPVAVTTLDQTRMERGHMRPQFLPDGRHLTFLASASERERNAVYVTALDSPERTPIEGVTSDVEYALPGYLIFAQDETLMARQFDLGRLEWRGEPMPLAEVRQQGFNRLTAFSVSQTGVLTYQGLVSPERQPIWLTREGKAVSSLPARAGIHTLSLAPDSERAIVDDAEGNDLWLLDGRRGTVSRFTTSPTVDSHPIWSPDGRRIAFSNGATFGARTLFVKVATGVSEAEPLLQTPTYKQVTDWSPDGRMIVFEEESRETGWNVGVVSVEGDSKPQFVIQSRFQERMGGLSPDGRYLAYTSNETGRTEVYVVTFPDVSDKWTISTDGGTAPRWRKDGNELFFVDPAGMLMSVPVSRGTRFEAGVPQPLFELQGIETDGFNYAVSNDGQRILVARPIDSGRTPITVVVNWPALMKVPGGP